MYSTLFQIKRNFIKHNYFLVNTHTHIYIKNQSLEKIQLDFN